MSPVEPEVLYIFTPPKIQPPGGGALFPLDSDAAVDPPVAFVIEYDSVSRLRSVQTPVHLVSARRRSFHVDWLRPRRPLAR